MKFPSLFKTAKHSHFHYEPRYYDPVKEEIKKKMEAAQKAKATQEANNDHYDASSISAAFRNRERKSSQASTLQLIIAIALMGTFVGWLVYGNDIFYIFLLLSPLYFYFRFKGFRKKQ